MQEFMENHELDPARWSLLATDEDGVRELAAVLGVKYRPEAGGEMAHSSIIFLIDAEGVIRHRQEGLNQGPDALLTAFRALE
jgi:protein SCO1/2